MKHIKRFNKFQVNEGIFDWLRKQFNSDEEIAMDIYRKITPDTVVEKDTTTNRLSYKFKLDNFDVVTSYLNLRISDNGNEANLEVSDKVKSDIFRRISNIYRTKHGDISVKNKYKSTITPKSEDDDWQDPLIKNMTGDRVTGFGGYSSSSTDFKSITF